MGLLCLTYSWWYWWWFNTGFSRLYIIVSLYGNMVVSYSGDIHGYMGYIMLYLYNSNQLYTTWNCLNMGNVHVFCQPRGGKSPGTSPAIMGSYCGWLRNPEQPQMVENLDNPPTGAGFRNHSQYDSQLLFWKSTTGYHQSHSGISPEFIGQTMVHGIQAGMEILIFGTSPAQTNWDPIIWRGSTRINPQ